MASSSTQADNRFQDNDLFKLYQMSDLNTLIKRKYLIKNFLDEGGMSLLYGASNSGKTFVALDLAYHIATGASWCGKKTKKGPVVYIAAEGGVGIKERILAMKQNFNNDEMPELYILPTQVSLRGSNDDTSKLIETLENIPNLKMVIVDTLARAINGGNENSSDDMGEFIKNCDRIRMQTNAHLMIIHHSGKNDAQGARGHSSLKAAVDTEIKVSKKNGKISTEITKQRDGETGQKLYFSLKTYQTSKDEDGEIISSCALNWECNKHQAQEGLQGQALETYHILCELINQEGFEHKNSQMGAKQRVVHLDTFKNRFLESKVVKSDKQDSTIRAFDRQKKTLEQKGYIALDRNYIWLLDN